MNFLENLWDKVKSLFSKADTLVHTIVTLADELVNKLKDLEESEAGQFLETAIETLIPASTGLINAFRLWLPIVVTDLNWAVQEEGKTSEEKIADAIAYLTKLKVINPDAYAAQLNTINALIQKWLSDNQGAGLNMPQALTITQVNHNPDLVATT